MTVFKQSTNHQIALGNQQPYIGALSHKMQRIFKPEKLSPPRGFEHPLFLLNCEPHKHRPLVLEIGAGKGQHAMRYADQNPDCNMIAIERTAAKFKAFEKKLGIRNSEGSQKDINKTENEQVSNLLAVHADAIPYCVYALPPASLDKVFILYPNPELKNPNQQWLNMPFYEFLLSRLKPKASISLATNIESYKDNALKQAQQLWSLPTKCIEVANTSSRTPFETKYLKRGETCWQLEMLKPIGYQTRFDVWVAETD